MADGRQPDPRTSHAAHDTLLIAALAADDLTGAARSDAEARLAACPDCAALHADLVAIAAATSTLPAPVRPRSFTLAPEQAARLAPSPWRRLLGGLRNPTGLARPLAATFTTLGIAGLLLTALPAIGPIGLGASSGPPVGLDPGPDGLPCRRALHEVPDLRAAAAAASAAASTLEIARDSLVPAYGAVVPKSGGGDPAR